MKILLFVIHLIWFHTASLQYIELDLSVKETESTLINPIMTMNLCLGDPPQCFDLIFDTGSFHTWVGRTGAPNTKPTFNHLFNPSQSASYSVPNTTLTFPFLNTEIRGEHAKDILRLNSKECDKETFDMLVIPDPIELSLNSDGVAGFARSYFQNTSIVMKHGAREVDISDKFSIMNFLFQHHKIQKKVYSMKILTQKKGKLYLGGLPEELHDTSFPKCKSINGNSYWNGLWNCQSHGAYLKPLSGSLQSEFNITKPVVFSSGTSHIIAPFEEGLSLITTYLKYTSGCNLSQKGDLVWMTCNSPIDISTLPDLVLKFEEGELVTHSSDLIKSVTTLQGQIYEFKIAFSAQHDYWIIGLLFLKNYHMVFDMDTNSVGFSPILGDCCPLFYGFISFVIIFVIISLVVFLSWCLWKRKLQGNSKSEAILG